MKAKSSSQMGAFFNPMFANWARAKNDVGSHLTKITTMAKIAKMVTIAKIAETEVVRFSKRSKFGFFWKVYGFFEKKLEFYSKSLKVANSL